MTRDLCFFPRMTLLSPAHRAMVVWESSQITVLFLQVTSARYFLPLVKVAICYVMKPHLILLASLYRTRYSLLVCSLGLCHDRLSHLFETILIYFFIVVDRITDVSHFCPFLQPLHPTPCPTQAFPILLSLSPMSLFNNTLVQATVFTSSH